MTEKIEIWQIWQAIERAVWSRDILKLKYCLDKLSTHPDWKGGTILVASEVRSNTMQGPDISDPPEEINGKI